MLSIPPPQAMGSESIIRMRQALQIPLHTRITFPNIRMTVDGTQTYLYTTGYNILPLAECH